MGRQIYTSFMCFRKIESVRARRREKWWEMKLVSVLILCALNLFSAFSRIHKIALQLSSHLFVCVKIWKLSRKRRSNGKNYKMQERKNGQKHAMSSHAYNLHAGFQFRYLFMHHLPAVWRRKKKMKNFTRKPTIHELKNTYEAMRRDGHNKKKKTPNTLWIMMQ